MLSSLTPSQFSCHIYSHCRKTCFLNSICLATRLGVQTLKHGHHSRNMPGSVGIGSLRIYRIIKYAILDFLVVLSAGLTRQLIYGHILSFLQNVLQFFPVLLLHHVLNGEICLDSYLRYLLLLRMPTLKICSTRHPCCAVVVMHVAGNCNGSCREFVRTVVSFEL